VANAWGRLSLMVEDCSAESVVDDIMERVDETAEFPVVNLVNWELLSMIDFDRSSD